MLQSLDIRNLTVFVEAHLRFSPRLNVIVGENGSGKSHLLKVVYAVLAASAEEGCKSTASAPTKTLLQTKVSAAACEATSRYVLREDGNMGTNAELYNADFYAWCLTTAALIREGKWHNIDLESAAEELESLGRSQKRELESRLEVLMMHLLKWCYQPERREDSHSWYDTIVEQRSQLARLLRDNPSLRPQVSTLLTEEYPNARRRAIGETQIFAAVFPPACPWTADQVLDAEFWPKTLSP